MTLRKGDELAGKVALVTGAGKNIGRATARALAAGGANVVVHANTSRDAAAETVRQIEADGGKACTVFADVTDPQAVDRMMAEAAGHFGRLDFLVNNHTLRGHTPFEDMTYEAWRAVVAVILDGTFLCSRAALPYLIEARDGAIVNFSGQGAFQGQRGGTHGSAAKLGVIGLTKAMALDVAKYGITVNCIVPGLIDTLGPEGEVRHTTAKTPFGRTGRPDEIAAMVRTLCGPDVKYMTGQTIHMNGGGLMP
jgi:3-oxoacyl-[acyl-carrier protein] reductase